MVPAQWWLPGKVTFLLQVARPIACLGVGFSSGEGPEAGPAVFAVNQVRICHRAACDGLIALSQATSSGWREPSEHCEDPRTLKVSLGFWVRGSAQSRMGTACMRVLEVPALGWYQVFQGPRQLGWVTGHPRAALVEGVSLEGSHLLPGPFQRSCRLLA